MVSKDKFARSIITNLNDAATGGKFEDVKYLVNCGEFIDHRQMITMEAPIHKAVLSSDARKKQALETIIDCKADMDILDSNGWTALHHAAYNGDIDSATILLDSGAKVDEYSNAQRTALHFAAAKNFVNIIELLISRSADIEAADINHATPLHFACKKGSLESVRLLLNKKANLYALDHRDWSPLHYAAYNGHPKVVKKLLTWGADTDPKLRNLLNSQNKIAFNICKNPETKYGFRIIWPAARDGDLDMVRVLIREGQDPNEQTEH
jgi:ankyrin repeat protein